MNLFTIFLIGFGILAGALVLNFIASKVGLTNWYDFLEDPGKTSVVSLIWLFLIYPFGLGATAYFIARLFDK